MNTGPRSLIFRLPVSYREAVAQTKRALAKGGLRVPAEINVASHIREEFGATLTPSVVLYVDDPALLLEAMVFQRDAALLMPQPVVVSGTESESEIVVSSVESLRDMGLPPSLRGPVLELHSRLVGVMATIAERETVPQITH